MGEIIFEVTEILPLLCSYPGCKRINGQTRRAKWLMRLVGSAQTPQPVCFMCKARVKAHLGAAEQKGAMSPGVPNDDTR